MLKNIVIAVVVVGVAILFVVRWQDNAGSSSSYAWVSIVPVQCGGNSWQSDSPIPEEVSELEVVKEFYQKQGITVFDIVSKRTHEIVCLACSCPRGDTLYLSVLKNDVPQMLKQGFVVAEAPEN